MNLQISVFVDALALTIKNMSGLEIDSDPPVELSKTKVNTDISAHIGVITDKKGILVLAVAQEAAFVLASKITGGSYDDLKDPMITDVMGELTNMVVGSAQKNSDTKFEFSLPTVVKGKDHEIDILSEEKIARVKSSLEGAEVSLYLVQPK